MFQSFRADMQRGFWIGCHGQQSIGSLLNSDRVIAEVAGKESAVLGGDGLFLLLACIDAAGSSWLSRISRVTFSGAGVLQWLRCFRWQGFLLLACPIIEKANDERGQEESNGDGDRF